MWHPYDVVHYRCDKDNLNRLEPLYYVQRKCAKYKLIVCGQIHVNLIDHFLIDSVSPMLVAPMSFYPPEMRLYHFLSSRIITIRASLTILVWWCFHCCTTISQTNHMNLSINRLASASEIQFTSLRKWHSMSCLRLTMSFSKSKSSNRL